MSQLPISLPFSEACERNKDVILELIAPYLKSASSVLEVGSGTAQHAVHFSRNCPALQWQTSDQAHYIEGIEAQLAVAEVSNVQRPLVLNVNQRPWVEEGRRFDAVYTANTFHIMTENDVLQFFAGLESVMNEQCLLIIYGPFKYGGQFTSDSNASFDHSLRSRGCGSEIRDFELVEELAERIGLRLVKDFTMPANNQLLVWQRS
jgi:hypothetical protein